MDDDVIRGTVFSACVRCHSLYFFIATQVDVIESHTSNFQILECEVGQKSEDINPRY